MSSLLSDDGESVKPRAYLTDDEVCIDLSNVKFDNLIGETSSKLTRDYIIGMLGPNYYDIILGTYLMLQDPEMYAEKISQNITMIMGNHQTGYTLDYPEEDDEINDSFQIYIRKVRDKTSAVVLDKGNLEYLIGDDDTVEGILDSYLLEENEEDKPLTAKEKLIYSYCFGAVCSLAYGIISKENAVGTMLTWGIITLVFYSVSDLVKSAYNYIKRPHGFENNVTKAVEENGDKDYESFEGQEAFLKAIKMNVSDVRTYFEQRVEILRKNQITGTDLPLDVLIGNKDMTSSDS